VRTARPRPDAKDPRPPGGPLHATSRLTSSAASCTTSHIRVHDDAASGAAARDAEARALTVGPDIILAPG
jgi:hypothetical protein